MMTKHTGIMETVKNGIVAAVKDTGDITKSGGGYRQQDAFHNLKDTGNVAASATKAIGHVAGGAIQGAAQAGEHLGHAAKGIVIGVLHGTKHVGSAAIDTIGHTAGQSSITLTQSAANWNTPRPVWWKAQFIPPKRSA